MGPIVEAACGSLEGVWDSVSPVAAFLGVPYAAPPVGPLRWRPPRPLTPWSGVRVATTVGPRCIQHAPYGELEPDNPRMSEDCLYLNIWTPDPSPAARLPVIFWIHGGEFWAGSGSEPRYHGARLAARGAVVVTINHRLGVFGFLAHPALAAESPEGDAGNYGLMDQIAALKWTVATIEAFGGDPSNIMIAGESAGSCSVSALMASPLSRGLFQRALGQSCAYFMPEAHAMKPLSWADNQARGVEFAAAAGAETLENLRALNVQQLLEVWLRAPAKRMQPQIGDAVLPRPVEAVFAAGEQAPTPLLAGWNGAEMGYLRAGAARFDAAVFKARVVNDFGENAERLLDAYAFDDDPLEASIALSSDRAMVYPTWKWLDQHAAVAPTFAYRFDRAPADRPYGATHASEIEYVFGALSPDRPWTEDDLRLSAAIGDFWVAFARTGDPGGGWPHYDGAEPMLMRLDREIRATPPPELSRLRLLDRLYTSPARAITAP